MTRSSISLGCGLSVKFGRKNGAKLKIKLSFLSMISIAFMLFPTRGITEAGQPIIDVQKKLFTWDNTSTVWPVKEDVHLLQYYDPNCKKLGKRFICNTCLVWVDSNPSNIDQCFRPTMNGYHFVDVMEKSYKNDLGWTASGVDFYRVYGKKLFEGQCVSMTEYSSPEEYLTANLELLYNIEEFDQAKQACFAVTHDK